MSIDFEEALPYSERKSRGDGTPKKERPPIHSGEGVHPGVFVGLTEPKVETNKWEKCQVCDGKGTGAPRNGQPGAPGGCYKCGGDGMRRDSKVSLVYEMDNGHTELEEVNFKVTPPGVGRDGKTPIGSSTLYDRFYALSRIKPKQGEKVVSSRALIDWYTGFGDGTTPVAGDGKVSVPMFLSVGDDPNHPGTLKIESVKPRNTDDAAPPARNPQAAPSAKPQTAPKPGGANGAGQQPASRFGKPGAKPSGQKPMADSGPPRDTTEGRQVHPDEKEWLNWMNDAKDEEDRKERKAAVNDGDQIQPTNGGYWFVNSYGRLVAAEKSEPPF